MIATARLAAMDEAQPFSNGWQLAKPPLPTVVSTRIGLIYEDVIDRHLKPHYWAQALLGASNGGSSNERFARHL